MNPNKNYYQLLQIEKNVDSIKIRKAYYKLSMKMHPDKGGDAAIFSEITEAYDILMDEEQRKEYDLKSRFGANYSSMEEFYDFSFDFDFKNDLKKRDTFKDKEILHIYLEVDDQFTGEVEYPRYVSCKTCSGSGQDLKGKIIVKDEMGNIKGVFESEEGCDFCEGSGLDWKGGKCHFCNGGGKIGLKPCDVCQGEKRILGKQKLTKIELVGDETKIEGMGHVSPLEKGKCGHLILKKKLA
jgi:DnaJ-class molecular chaperone